MPDTDRLARLYTAIEHASQEREPTFRERPEEERRAYMREAKRISRAKAKAAADIGRIEANAETIRDALADAALVLLASGAPGADAVEKLLGIAFSGRPGVPGTVRAKARVGAIKPKLLTAEVLRAHAMSQTALVILDRAPDVPPEPGDEINF
jgi:hypothetical protein